MSQPSDKSEYHPSDKSEYVAQVVCKKQSRTERGHISELKVFKHLEKNSQRKRTPSKVTLGNKSVESAL
jgi:hypothetical protein